MYEHEECEGGEEDGCCQSHGGPLAKEFEGSSANNFTILLPFFRNL